MREDFKACTNQRTASPQYAAAGGYARHAHTSLSSDAYEPGERSPGAAVLPASVAQVESDDDADTKSVPLSRLAQIFDSNDNFTAIPLLPMSLLWTLLSG